MTDEQKEPAVDEQTAAEANGAEATAPAETEGLTVEQLRERLAQAEAQATEYKDQWLRSAADFKNYKRRTETERAELIRSASAGLVLKMLPVLDDFERAIANIPQEIAATPWWGGTQLIAQKFRTILESEGVSPIEAVGHEFDPNVHEAVIYEDAPGQDGIVVEELQKGYKLRDRVLRPAMVKVGRG